MDQKTEKTNAVARRKRRLGKISRKKGIGLLALLVVLAVGAGIFISHQTRANTYQQILSVFYAEEIPPVPSLDGVEEKLDRLPDSYRDTEQLRGYLEALRQYNEEDRSSYRKTLDALDGLGPFEDARVAEQYNKTVSKLSVLERQYETDLTAAESVAAAIAALPEEKQLVYSDAPQVAAVRALYDGCSDEAKALISNRDVLFQAEERMELLESYQAKANDVMTQIDDIGAVTLAQASAIKAAQSAYDGLPDEAKSLVTNQEVLTAAQTQLNLLQSAKTVSDQIDQIGVVTKESGEVLGKVQTAYDNLPDGAKQYVQNSGKLKKAQNDFSSLQNSTGKASSPTTNSSRTYYWVSSGKVYHTTPDCPTLSRSKNIQSGSPPAGRRVCKVCS